MARRALLLLALLGLTSCVLPAVPENMLAGTLVLTADRLALLEDVQPVAPGDDPQGRFAVDLVCQDGDQLLRSETWLDADGTGLFEILIPQASQPEPWTCSFSARGTVEAQCLEGPCDYDTRFALGTLRSCDSESGVLFSWNGASRWLGDVLADGTDACVFASDGVSAEVLAYDDTAVEMDAVTWCGSVTVSESIDEELGAAVGWSPFLCYRLVTVDGEDFVSAAAYRGLELGQDQVGCPIFGPLGWKVAVQVDDALGFTSRAPSLENPDLGGTNLGLSAVLWEQSVGMEGRFILSAWSGTFGEGPIATGVPGGMVLQTSGPMSNLGVVDIPAVLLRDSTDGCQDQRD